MLLNFHSQFSWAYLTDFHSIMDCIFKAWLFYVCCLFYENFGALWRKWWLCELLSVCFGLSLFVSPRQWFEKRGWRLSKGHYLVNWFAMYLLLFFFLDSLEKKANDGMGSIPAQANRNRVECPHHWLFFSEEQPVKTYLDYNGHVDSKIELEVDRNVVFYRLGPEKEYFSQCRKLSVRKVVVT
jgi:hypothetical protein